MSRKVDSHYDAIEAVLQQLARVKRDGGDQIYFGALSDHPESDDETAFGDLITEAAANYEVKCEMHRFAVNDLKDTAQKMRNLLAAAENVIESTVLNGQRFSVMPSCGAFADLDAAISAIKEGE